MTIAERKLVLRREGESSRIEVRVAIRSIEQAKDMPEFTCCEVETTAGDCRIERIYGLDSIHALSLGLLAIVNFLRTLHQEGELLWPNGDNYDVDADYSFIKPFSDIAKGFGIDDSQ